MVDARNVKHPEKLLSLLTDQLSQDAVLVIGLDKEVAVSGRRVVTAHLASTAGVTA